MKKERERKGNEREKKKRKEREGKGRERKGKEGKGRGRDDACQRIEQKESKGKGGYACVRVFTCARALFLKFELTGESMTRDMGGMF